MAATSGNARKKQTTDEVGAWVDWVETDRADRAIRFIETYCRPPKGHGFGKPMVLTDEQKSWFRDILADDVSLAIKSCPRGEGKSTEFAALAIWATFDTSPTGQPQVPIVATTVGQAVRSVYGVAIEMIKAEPELETRCTIYTAMGSTRFEVLATGGSCFPIASDPAGLQGLDPSLAIVDEIGFQPIETWDSLQLASGKRANSLVVGIGTPGLNRNNALWQLRTLIRENGCPEGMVYREIAAPDGCDYKDESVWYACSPALRAGYKNVKALRTAVGITPEAHFRIFYLGQWVEGSDAWLGPDGRKLWDVMESPYVLDPEQPILCALDVGVKRDSTALLILQRRVDTGKIHVKAKIWIPSKDEPVDVTDVMQYIRVLHQDYNLRMVGYDPRLFEVPSSMLRDEGINMVEFPQSLERMTPAIGDLYTALMETKLTHDHDDLFAQQVLNAVPRYNDRGFMLSKSRSNGRIDAAIALAMVWSLFTHPERVKSPLVCL
jgi:phage terminase large subunit-like protein